MNTCPRCSRKAEWKISEGIYHALYGRIVKWILVCEKCGTVKHEEHRSELLKK